MIRDEIRYQSGGGKMGFWEDLRAKLRGDSRRSTEAADQDLAADLAKIRQADIVDLEALKPQLLDVDAFKILVATVKVSKALNENLAKLQARIKALGEDIICVAKESAKLL
ncbi:hypothetical protein KKG45_08810 [bacterium]|nr:hypothetical protein [bacterium]MBU1073334.1 hypothetical protein [bacterium]MBU1676449.1 hypothetical protein [bacterium]